MTDALDRRTALMEAFAEIAGIVERRNAGELDDLSALVAIRRIAGDAIGATEPNHPRPAAISPGRITQWRALIQTRRMMRREPGDPITIADHELEALLDVNEAVRARREGRPP